MARTSFALLLFGAAAVLAFPQHTKEFKQPSWWPDKLPWPPQQPDSIQHPDSIQWPPQKPSWWPDKLPWPPQKPDSIQHPDSIQWPPQKPSWWPDKLPWPPQIPATNALLTSEARKISHPEWIPWPPANWFPEEAPGWWPDGWKWPPRPSHPEWIPWPPANWFPEEAPGWWPDGWKWPPRPTHPEWIPWPPANWFPEEAPGWWPEGWEWPPRPSHPDWIQWPPQHPEWIPWPPSEWFPEDAPSWWPEGWEWPPRPSHPDWIQWPPQHPEWIPWPPSEWFPEDAPSWWPEGWEWPPRPSHPDWIPWPPQHPEWIPWPPSEWFPEDAPSWWPEGWEWPPKHPEWIPTEWPYLPSRDNQFHLFTRFNSFISQPLVLQNEFLLEISNYASSRPTVVLVHGLDDVPTGQFNSILVPALLAAADVNVIVVDWSVGANSLPSLSTFYAVQSGRNVATFLTWLTEASSGKLSDFHLIGHGLGGWNVGFISRVLKGNVGYITALDPLHGPVDVSVVLPPLNNKDAIYTEVIHTNARQAGYSSSLGDVTFYPNGGSNMPGCGGDRACSRLRAAFFFAESVQSGGFTGIQCESVEEAVEGNCKGPQTLKMGGLKPKTGSSGVFYLTTNALSPFSQG